jgi:hypothetical protein
LVDFQAAVESMLQTGFTPKRTIVLSFGFDEEVSGPQGAAHLAKHLEAIYGPDSFALILDEGVSPLLSQDDCLLFQGLLTDSVAMTILQGGYMNVFGANIAAFGTAEKGVSFLPASSNI